MDKNITNPNGLSPERQVRTMEALTWTGKRAALRCTSAKRGLKAFLGFLTTLCLVAGLLVGLGVESAWARTRVFSGEFDASGVANTVQTLAETVDTSKSIILFTFHTVSTTPKYQDWAARFNPASQSGDSNNQVEFDRNASATGFQKIKYFVI